MRNLKILSFDGGGLKGLSSLLLLLHVFNKIKTRIREPRLKPCDYFDIIGGTSMGGIIALMLGRLRMDIEECIAVYKLLSESVFKSRRKFHSSIYNKAILEKVIKKVVKERTGNEDSLLWEPSGCKTVVFTVSLLHPRAKPDALRSWSSRHGQSRKIKIWEAARATSAAPRYLDPIQLNLGGVPLDYIDVGLGSHNPTESLLEEAEKEWGELEETYYHHEQIGLLLSLGTGFRDVKRVNMKHPLHRILSKVGKPIAYVSVLQDMATNPESTHQAMQRYQIKGYFRFNVQQGFQAIELFEYKRLPEIAADTQAYLRNCSAETDRCEKHAKRIAISGFYSNALNVTPPASGRSRSRSPTPSRTPVPSLFLQLDKRSTYIKSKTENEDPYWSRITAGGLEMYEKIFEVIPQTLGYVSYSSFCSYFEVYDISPMTLKNIWSRLDLEMKWAPKNYVLALICMLHFESDRCFPSIQPHSRSAAVTISKNRENIIKRFGNWVSCRCGFDSCYLQWSFPGERRGTCRGVAAEGCSTFKESQGWKLQSHELEQAKTTSDLNLDAWLCTEAQEPCFYLQTGETAV